MRFHWRYRDERVSGGGRGQIRLAPPDSLRLDYVATLGLASGAGVVIGDSLVWADPDKDFRALVRGAAILWAALGTARPPAADAIVSGRQDSGQVIWRFVQGADTLDYVASAAAPRRLEAEWRRAGKIEARSRTLYDAQARPASARIDVPEEQARFELTIVAVDTAAVIAPALWRSRR